MGTVPWGSGGASNHCAHTRVGTLCGPANSGILSRWAQNSGSGHETHTDATGVDFVSSNWVLGGVSSPLGVAQAVEI